MIINKDIDQMTEEEQEAALKQLQVFNDLIATCKILENTILISESFKRTAMVFVFSALAVVATKFFGASLDIESPLGLTVIVCLFNLTLHTIYENSASKSYVPHYMKIVQAFLDKNPGFKKMFTELKEKNEKED